MANDEDEYEIQPPPEAPPQPLESPPRVRVFEKLAEIRRPEVPPPPASTFFSRVFEFPWTRDVWPRWALLSFGCTAMLLLAAFIAWMAVNVGGAASLAVAFFVLPEIWVTLWTLAYAASCSLAIIEDTAAGNRDVVEWPDPNWREWAARLGYLAFLLGVSLSFSFAVAHLLQWTSGVPVVVTTFLCAVVLFPLVLLSSLHENLIWMVFSPGLTWELVRKPGPTLTCYGLLAAVWAVASGLVWVGFRFTPGALFLAGPVVAAAILISARLIGRLAWETQKGQKKKQRRDEPQADADESPIPPRSW